MINLGWRKLLLLLHGRLLLKLRRSKTSFKSSKMLWWRSNTELVIIWGCAKIVVIVHWWKLMLRRSSSIAILRWRPMRLLKLIVLHRRRLSWQTKRIIAGTISSTKSSPNISSVTSDISVYRRWPKWIKVIVVLHHGKQRRWSTLKVVVICLLSFDKIIAATIIIIIEVHDVLWRLILWLLHRHWWPHHLRRHLLVKVVSWSFTCWIRRWSWRRIII